MTTNKAKKSGTDWIRTYYASKVVSLIGEGQFSEV